MAENKPVVKKKVANADFTFKLSGCKWKVHLVSTQKFDEDIARIGGAEDGLVAKHLMGLTDYSVQEIWVRRELSPQVKVITLWHEIFHAIHAPLNDSPTFGQFAALDSETSANLVGSAMLELIPQAVKWPEWTRGGKE